MRMSDSTSIARNSVDSTGRNPRGPGNGTGKGGAWAEVTSFRKDRVRVETKDSVQVMNSRSRTVIWIDRTEETYSIRGDETERVDSDSISSEERVNR